LAEKAGALDWALSAHEFRLGALIELGRMESADQEIERYAALQERAQTSSGTVERYRAMRCLMCGDFEDAERFALEGIGIAGRRGDQPLATAFGTMLIQIRIEQGRVAENEHMISDYAAQFPNLALPRCGLADLYAREGIESKARHEFERLAADDFGAIPRDWNWICGLATLCGVCVFLHDERRGAILYELLRPYAGRNVTIGWGDVSYGSVDHYLGRLAVLTGRLDEAESHFVLALGFNERMGARTLVAHTRFEYGIALLARDRARDRQTALQLLRQALDTAAALGMKDLEDRARALIAEKLEHETPSKFTRAEGVGAEQQRAIATVLFTDLVDSTERLSEMKDRRWVELLQKFHQAQLEQLAKFEGRRILTAGDGMLAIFNHPAEAIRCALAIVASAKQIGLQVRSGIHTGECEFVGDDVAGIAVHIGARVAARAGAGEVIVSSTVRELLAGGDTVFNDLGLAALKGIPGEWRLYAVERPDW
jgi:class 3 adenylate cyclase